MAYDYFQRGNNHLFVRAKGDATILSIFSAELDRNDESSGRRGAEPLRFVFVSTLVQRRRRKKTTKTEDKQTSRNLLEKLLGANLAEYIIARLIDSERART